MRLQTRPAGAPVAVASRQAAADPGIPERLPDVIASHLWVVVPAFNEGAVIAAVVTELRGLPARVVVVDDGSDDQTGNVAFRAGAVVLRHPINLGQGAALQTGIEYALRRDAGFVATFDADGQHHAADLAQMVAVLRERQLDVVLGSRFLGSAEDLPALRALLLRAAAVLTGLTTGVRLTDAHNGMRVMTASAAGRLELVQNQMAHASEFIAQIGRLDLLFAEVPVTVTYTRYSLHKGQRLSNSIRILADLIVGWLLR